MQSTTYHTAEPRLGKNNEIVNIITEILTKEWRILILSDDKNYVTLLLDVLNILITGVLHYDSQFILI
jgi:hypothetical protein